MELNHQSKLEQRELVPTDRVITYDSSNNPYSRYSDKEWVFLCEKVTISFKSLSGKFEITIKDIVLKIIKANTLSSKLSTLRNLINGASTFQGLIEKHGGTSYRDLDNNLIYNSVVAEAKFLNLRYKTWKNHLILLPILAHEGYIERIIGKADDLAYYLAGNSKFAKQTMAIPEKIAAMYFQEAISIVDEFHTERYTISKLYEEFFIEVNKTGRSKAQLKSAASKAYKKIGSHSFIELDLTGTWLAGLRGACYTVIAAFSGCRDGEIRSLNLSSYQEKEYAGFTIPILNGFDTKPNKGGVKRAVSWVTIPVVKKAIELLWESYQFARDYWVERSEQIQHKDERNNYLEDVNSILVNFPVPSAINPKAGRQAVDRSLRVFINSVGYLATPDDVKEYNLLNPTRHGELKVGETLIPHPHSFRRTFAVYLVRNKLASLLDLKYQFKHMNLAMTSWYSNQAHVASYLDMVMDTNLQTEISSESTSYITDTLYYVYNEAETLAGPEGKRILGLRAKSKSTIYLSRDEISQQVKEGRLSIIEHPTGHCTNPSCDRICDMTTCQYKVVTKNKALELITMREKLIKKFTMMNEARVNQPNILSKIYFEIRSIEKVLDEHTLTYPQFSADISVTLL
ncbi:site-specific integrase [Pseudoalteromonas peptidolytica]|uniref:site-specific integrase n=1 Tax=Pseudoalteromonas peptidolytica TaxID=61150 RepID=UPI00298DC63F|nr:site-specific integrase [Pseudoalteromonas peptidolytica]MDW7549816.1 site-specific integrase [Pseudoalteromonas peptidolytica]